MPGESSQGKTSCLPGLRARAFGVEPEDREVGFHASSAPELVTEILGLCLRTAEGNSPRPEELWALTVSQRTYLLWKVATASQGGRLALHATCGTPTCGEPLELEFELRELEGEVHASSERRKVIWRDMEWEARFPTGEDQRRWWGKGSAATMRPSVEIASALMLEPACSWNGRSDAELSELETLLSDSDALVDFEVTTQCPRCEQNVRIEFDLEALALDKLQASQARQLRDIHELARRYHWPEREIAGLPAWRREFYLDLLEREGGLR